MMMMMMLRRITGSRWVVAAPDLDVQVEDLNDHELVAFGRAAPFPLSWAVSTRSIPSPTGTSRS